MATAPGASQKPATADTGFIFSMPERDHPLTSDVAFLRVLSWYLPKDILAAVTPELARIAEEAASDPVKRWTCDAEVRQPYVKTHNVWGARYDVDNLVTSDGWKNLRSWGAHNGIVAIAYEPQYGQYRRIVQHAKNYFFGPSSALTGCPLSMTDGAAKLLAEVLPTLPPSHPFHEVYRRLTSRTDNWTSGQWMTERAGGSDVQNTETWATYAPLSQKTGGHGRLDEGDYLVSGFKFFSSATDADIAVLLAKTESGKLSAFLAPLTKQITDADGKVRIVSNGIRIHRLKNKLGTKQLPTAELELKDVRAHLVGPLDRGVKTISHILNVTRAHAFMGSVAGWRRCLSIAKAFARARSTWGVPLWKLPLHLRTLADMELKTRASLHLAFFTVSLMSFTENGFPPEVGSGTHAAIPKEGAEARVVLRALTATSKAVIAKSTSSGIQECMEAMGGVGYMDEPDEPENLARAFRDSNVNTIWEGTTNVLSSEVVRNLVKDDNLEIFSNWLNRAIAGLTNKDYRETLSDAWQNLFRKLEGGKGNFIDLLGDGRRIMFSLAWVVMALLLAADAQRDGEAVADEMARRWILNGEGGVGEWLLPNIGGSNAKARFQEGDERVRWDARLVWGNTLPEAPQAIRTGQPKI
ncbi:Acyl-CoA dehydrogenase [Purpureocillium lavendulum]|uniref:Acyl-CoA dehydrogenase n=1 Tax=Purpureocillium lavendulum TaxID=1247861 RepID=A0AB34FRH5_9HYPO|nr:Acyl-CoA dehydrogenase [Purpureocillium lavendulum]